MRESSGLLDTVRVGHYPGPMTTTQITRPSVLTGRPVSRRIYVVRDWTTYTGTEQGRPVIVTYVPQGPEHHEVLTAAEQATLVGV